jgi:hypothetical protein
MREQELFSVHISYPSPQNYERITAQLQRLGCSLVDDGRYTITLPPRSSQTHARRLTIVEHGPMSHVPATAWTSLILQMQRYVSHVEVDGRACTIHWVWQRKRMFAQDGMPLSANSTLSWEVLSNNLEDRANPEIGSTGTPDPASSMDFGFSCAF